MTMKVQLIAIVLLLSFVLRGIVGEPPSPEYFAEMSALQEVRPSEAHKRVRVFPPAKKAYWIEQLRKFNPERAYDAQDFSTLTIEMLLALGDDETGRWLVRYAGTDPDISLCLMFLEWHSPESIAFLAKLTYSDVPFSVTGSDLPRAPISFEASEILLDRFLPDLDFLPASVRHWAHALKGQREAVVNELNAPSDEVNREHDDEANRYTEYRIREIAQRWWKENGQAVMAAAWANVKPGEDYQTPKLERILARLHPHRAQTQLPPKGSGKGPVTSPIATVHADEVQAPKTVTVGSPTRDLAVAGGLLLVAGVGAVAWRMRSSRGRVSQEKDR